MQNYDELFLYYVRCSDFGYHIDISSEPNIIIAVENAAY